MKTNLQIYPVKNQISLIKANPKINRMMNEAKNWEQLKDFILSIVEASEDAIKFFETKYKSN